MGLKIKQVANLTDEFGYSADTSFGITNVNFDYKQRKVFITYELTPTGWKKGEARKTKTQVIEVDVADQETIGLLVTVSDKLHTMNGSVPFIPSKDGTLKSFDDLGGVTIDVGLPSGE